jgi:hypothetical protein
MKKFDHRERFALEAAEGWLMLGCANEAAKELDAVSTHHLNRPEVLCLRWAISFYGRRWEDARSIAKVWCWTTPESLEAWIALANATRESEGLLPAKQILLDVTKRFPLDWVVPYNLACYSSQLGEIAEAVLWLNKALSLEVPQKLRKEAAGDPDLAPLWEALTKASFHEELCSEDS